MHMFWDFLGTDRADQYALDFDTYIKWKAVASLLPQDNDRRLFQLSAGRLVLESLIPSVEPYDAGRDGLGEALPAIKSLLQEAKSRGLIGAFSLDSSDYDPKFWSAEPGAATTALSITIDQPVGLYALLQLGGEGVGIKPDLMGSAIAAYLQACGVSAEGQPYFVDSVYRPNPDDYLPSQLILDFSLRPMRSPPS